MNDNPAHTSSCYLYNGLSMLRRMSARQRYGNNAYNKQQRITMNKIKTGIAPGPEFKSDSPYLATKEILAENTKLINLVH